MNICIIDDHSLFREAFKSMLSKFTDLSIVADFGSAHHFLDWLDGAQIMPDILLLDLELPGMNGIELMEQLRDSHPDIKVIIVSMHVRTSLVSGLVDQGVHGYVSKNSEPAEIRSAITSVYEFGYYFGKDVLDALHRSGFGERKRSKDETYGFNITEREKQVLQMICLELSSSEIAERLHLSSRTVEGHRNNLLQKSGVKNMAGLVLFAVRNGFVDPWLSVKKASKYQL